MPALPNIIVYLPQSDKGKQDLARRVATVHADSVDNKLRKINCPNKQKVELLDEIINSSKKKTSTYS